MNDVEKQKRTARCLKLFLADGKRVGDNQIRFFYNPQTGAVPTPGNGEYEQLEKGTIGYMDAHQECLDRRFKIIIQFYVDEKTTEGAREHLRKSARRHNMGNHSQFEKYPRIQTLI